MGDLKSHDDEETEQFLKKLNEYAKCIAVNEGYDVDTRKISTEGGSYMGVLYEIDIKGMTRDGDKITNIFVKNSIDTSKQLTFSVYDVFEREYFIYSDLVKQFNELQDERNIPDSDRYKITKAFEPCNAKTIIIENLTAQGFITPNRMDVVSLEYAELAVKNLARLHSLSFVIKKFRPDYFDEKIKDLECIYKFDENWKGFTENMKSFVYPFLDEDVRKKVQSKIDDVVNKYHRYLRDESCIRTICHGDYRHSNIMVKELNGKPTEVIAVDYQIVHYGDPVLDLIYFIFWGSDQEFRRRHMSHLKDLYHSYMGTFLEYFHICAEDVFPKVYLDQQFKDKLDFGAMIAVFYLPFLFPPEDGVPDLFNNNETLGNMSMKVDKKFEERFRGIVEDFILWGYL